VGKTLLEVELMKLLRKGFDSFFEIGALAAFCGMLLAVLVQVFANYFLALPTEWAEELSRFLCVWTVFLASASAVKKGAHITINVVLRSLSGGARLLVTLFLEIITALFLLCVFWGSISVMGSSYNVLATGLEISMSYFYLGLVVGSFGMLVYLFVGMARTIRGFFTS
jgi:TRAP-type C4-dicarboxylate transport system permease small subunit